MLVYNNHLYSISLAYVGLYSESCKGNCVYKDKSVCVCVRLFGCEHSQGGKNKLIYYGCSDSVVCIVFPQLKVSVVEFAHCSIRFSFTVELDQELGYNCLLFTG